MQKLLLATQNQGKLSEMRTLLADCGVEIISPADTKLDPHFDVEEIGESFTEISEKKAREYAQATGLMCLADDSGLMIDALGGQPGVKSKRFIPGSDADRNNKVLELLQGVTERSARFVTVMCLYDPSTQEKHFFEGVVHGRIADVPSGSAGFGYDPVFIPEGFDKTFAQLGQDVKNTLSHRARALQKVKEFFLAQKEK